MNFFIATGKNQMTNKAPKSIMKYIRNKYGLPLSIPFEKIPKILSKDDYAMYIHAMKYPNGMPDDQTPE